MLFSDPAEHHKVIENKKPRRSGVFLFAVSQSLARILVRLHELRL
jgi:hypothetical protein